MSQLLVALILAVLPGGGVHAARLGQLSLLEVSAAEALDNLQGATGHAQADGVKGEEGSKKKAAKTTERHKRRPSVKKAADRFARLEHMESILRGEDAEERGVLLGVSSGASATGGGGANGLGHGGAAGRAQVQQVHGSGGLLLELVSNSSGSTRVVARAKVTAYTNPGVGVILLFFFVSLCCGGMGIRIGSGGGSPESPGIDNDDAHGNALDMASTLSPRSLSPRWQPRDDYAGSTALHKGHTSSFRGMQEHRSLTLPAPSILSTPGVLMQAAKRVTQASITFFRADTDSEVEGIAESSGMKVSKTEQAYAERLEKLAALAEELRGDFKKYPKDRGKNTIFPPRDRYFAVVPAEVVGDDVDEGGLEKARRDLQRWKLGRLSYWVDRGTFKQSSDPKGFVDLAAVQEITCHPLSNEVNVEFEDNDGVKFELVIVFPSKGAAHVWKQTFADFLSVVGHSSFGSPDSA